MRRPYPPERRAYDNMLKRCYYETDDSYSYYGGRGIRVCAQWKRSFITFLTDVGKRPSRRHSLDRLNSNRNYTPRNTRWATKKQQMRNRRNNVLISLNGKTMTLAERAIRSKRIGYGTMKSRIHRGWSRKDAVTRMVRKLRKQLSESEIRLIAKLYATGEWKQRELAIRFNSTQGNISYAIIRACRSERNT